MKPKRLVSTLINISLAAVSIAFGVFAADAFVGRFCVIGPSFQQAPNAEYDFESDAFRFHVKLNSHGFREREFSGHKKPGVKRAVFLGDSMVFGWGVNADESFVRLVEKQLCERHGESSWEVCNLGVEGANPVDYRDNLASFGPQLAPDLVIVGFYTGNDVISDLPEIRLRKRPTIWHNVLAFEPRNLIDFLSVRYTLWKQGRPEHAMPGSGAENPLSDLVESQDPKVRERIQAVSPEVLEKALAWRLNPHLIKGGIEEPSLFGRQVRLDNEILQNAATRKCLQEMADLAKGLGSELRLLIIPPSYTVSRAMFPVLQSMGYSVDDRLLQNRRQQEILGRYADELGVQWFDLTPFLEKAGDSAFFDSDPHWTAHGNAVVGGAVSDWLSGKIGQPAFGSVALPEMTVVKRWDFGVENDSGGWRAASKTTTLTCTPEGLQVMSEAGEPSMVIQFHGIESSRVNRLRICMKAGQGRFGRFYWGKAIEGTYPFSNDRLTAFPVVAGEESQIYDIALDHASAGWDGTPDVFRLDPAALHASEGSVDGQPITIRWIELGFCSAGAETASVWPHPCNGLPQ